MTRWYRPPVPGVERVPAVHWLNQQAQRFLRRHRIPREVLIDWRLGVVPKALERELGYTGRRALDVAGGFNIPCFHPAEPERITGFIRQNYGQLFAYAATGSRGIAGRQDIANATYSTMVLVDNPMLALWLARRDVRCVALVLDPAQLDGLWGWFRGKRVVIAGPSPRRAERWRELIVARADRPRSVEVLVLPKVRRQITAVRLDALDQEVAFHPPPEPVLPPLPQVLQALVGHTRRRRDPDLRRQVLQDVGIPAPLAAALQADILDVRSRWPVRYRRFVERHDWGMRGLLLPARSAPGACVDMLAYPTHPTPRRPVITIRRAPVGVVMTTALADAHRLPDRTTVHLVDHRMIALAGTLWTAGMTHIAIVRGTADLRDNVIPLVQRRRLRTVEIHTLAPRTWATRLRAAGITALPHRDRAAATSPKR